MDRFELYRLLAADQLDLLDERGKEVLREALARHPGVDVATFVARAREALNSEEDLEAFVAALDEAEREAAPGGATPPPVPLPRPRSFTVRPLRIALAAAAVTLVLWAGGQWLGRDRGAGPGIVIHLDTTRAEGAARVDLDAGTGPRVTLVATVREPGVLTWELQDGALAVIERGALAAAPDGAAPRVVSVSIAKDRLRAASHYWLVVRDAGGAVAGQWAFETE